MATSKQERATLDKTIGQVNALLGGQAQAPEFFRTGINKALGENLPLLREGAALASQMYTLPGQLMSQYQQEFGNTFGGASGLARMNSVLGQIGSKAGLLQLANELAKQRGAKIQDVANSLTGQYGLMVDAAKQKYQMQLPFWQAAVQAEENARNRAGSGGQSWSNLLKLLANQKEQPKTTTSTYKPLASAPVQGGIASTPTGTLMPGKMLSNQYGISNPLQSKPKQSTGYSFLNPLKR